MTDVQGWAAARGQPAEQAPHLGRRGTLGATRSVIIALVLGRTLAPAGLGATLGAIARTLGRRTLLRLGNLPIGLQPKALMTFPVFAARASAETVDKSPIGLPFQDQREAWRSCPKARMSGGRETQDRSPSPPAAS